ncbi:glycosyltransferase family 2 protein [Pedobacter metabolipauper]|uniref:Cellulose synthase/poly-beta-1,6-N-acetylglucosamine synthase-like glycosyltransferase n=1 Tax=Pedobacter metabolipauper TaxID=425513 RepID=A0A4R6T0S8_9SPHI|nr:glycosyltransferase family 2 protein [Pedobacter metabolipauper]TDQ11987.1 cellulose synthase/poly-beta-1,6-N-acetylglucosamine synthase-like glycosyltransferase [Pedobacter metabolipauper]
MIISFWIAIFLVFYTFFGYGILLYLMVRIKRIIKTSKRKQYDFNSLPSCTLIVAAYNEADFIDEKIKNTLELNYPAGKLELVFVTDGSSDGTNELVAKYPEIKLLHAPERKGKISAVHRAIEQVTSEVIVFTDANTFLNADALVLICRHYADENVGAIAGEKRVMVDASADATAGEGFYWKYESKLKAWDSELYSVVGAAGELFSIRKSLYVPVPVNSVLDDFMISMRIAEKGYVIVYEPEAYAQETSSANIKEELKRKVRIAAGGIQSVIWLKSLLNPFQFPVLSFQYVSHRVLRWTITPFLMIAAFILNLIIVLNNPSIVYGCIFGGQILFYLSAWLGKVLEDKKVRVKLLFVPYYFCMMNYAVLAGLHRYFFGEQSVIWEKAVRK